MQRIICKIQESKRMQGKAPNMVAMRGLQEILEKSDFAVNGFDSFLSSPTSEGLYVEIFPLVFREEDIKGAIGTALLFGFEAHKTVHLAYPGEVDKPHIRQQIKALSEYGYYSRNIHLALDFTCDNVLEIAGKFQIIKNHVFYAKSN